MESRDHHCHNVSIHFVQLPNTFLWTSWLYGYASFLYRQNNSSLGGIFWTKKQNMLFTYSEYDPSYYFSSKTSLLRSKILIYISNVVIDHFQHTGNEFTGHCFVDEFLLRYLSISIDVNNLQNLFCSFVQNIIGNLRSKVNCDHGDDSGIHLHPNHCVEAWHHGLHLLWFE